MNFTIMYTGIGTSGRTGESRREQASHLRHGLQKSKNLHQRGIFTAGNDVGVSIYKHAGCMFRKEIAS